MNSTKPSINVTPLIDVLLVLLIIFMVISPLKPTGFKAKIPQESKQKSAQPNIDTLIVALNPDSSLKLNKEDDLGTVEQPDKLVARLSQIFKERTENHDYSPNTEFKAELSEADKIEKTVFIKAPRSIDYGKVAKLIDAVNLSGANPISLQIDDLP